MYRLRIMGASVTLLLVFFLSHPAEAYHLKRHHHAVQHTHHLAHRGTCRPWKQGLVVCSPDDHGRRVAMADAHGSSIVTHDGTVIGSRPAGCPHAYCGCGLRKYLGLSDKRLNLAYNWERLFPREPAPRAGLAAVRHHHVMYIEAAAGDGQWLVRDYNSGGGLSRLHVRDVHGYVFVNPHAQIAAR